MIYGGHFDCTEKEKQINALEEEINAPSFWDQERSKTEKVTQTLSTLKGQIMSLQEIRKQISSHLELVELLETEEDKTVQASIEEELKNLKKDLEQESLHLLLSGAYDQNNCILEIHAGAGGTEACDWAEMLYRMYLRYLEKTKRKVTLLEYQAGEEAGIKSVTIRVEGNYAYGYLKGEKGVHRLVRLSPFDSSNRRHTSFASVDVTPEFDEEVTVDIDEKDLKIDVYRSQGAGGQGVNTTDSAVRITHLPTKTVVTCQNERSQIQNKEQAMRMLKSKLYVLEQQKREQEVASIKGIQRNIEFGSQIRSYVMHPYSMVKDHRTNYETSNVSSVLDGNLDELIESYLKGAE